MDSLKDFRKLIHELHENGCKICFFIGDNPKRAIARNALQFNALYPCEYCFQRGTNIKNCDPDTAQKQRNLLSPISILTEKIEQLNPDEDADEIETLNAIKEGILSSLREFKKKEAKLYGQAHQLMVKFAQRTKLRK